jgi:hypothetical protein
MFSAIKKIGVYLIISFLFINNFAFANKPKITNIIIADSKQHLLFFLNVEEAFNEKICRRIDSGIPISFSYILKLHKVRTLWIDKEIANIKLTNTIKYNGLKKEYTVTKSWSDAKPYVTKSFAEAKRFMTKIDGFKICTIDKLEKGQEYKAKVKAEFSKVTLPLYLHYVLFFVSFWNIETNWHTVDFIY